MKIIEDTKLDYDDVLIVPRYSEIKSRKDVSLAVDYKLKYALWRYTGTPILAANMEGVGTVSMALALNKFNMDTVLTKKASIEMRPGIGIPTISMQTFNPNKEYGDIVCLDVANGYTSDFISFVKEVRSYLANTIIIAGNVATPEGVMHLVEAGADVVKVGIGPGSVCTTRLKTGVGYPQLSAVMECARQAHVMGAHIVADGGCKTPGDVAKAFAAGADLVMLGGMLAGHYESEQEMVYESASGSGIEFHGSAYNNNEDYKTAEGKSVYVPYRGPVENTIKDILGGLRSACSYVGASNLLELREKAQFVKVNRTHNKVFE